MAKSDGTQRTRTSLLKRRREPIEQDDGATDKRRRIAGERPHSARTETTEPASPPSAQQESPSRTLAESFRESLTGPNPRRARLRATAEAALIGLVTGLVLTGLVYAGMQAFQAIYHTPAGHGVGAVVLIAVVIVAALLGRYLLAWRGLADPNATALLGILLMAIVTLGVLLPIAFSGWMLVITPVLGAAAYLAAHLLIVSFGD